jgi:hypothetical protein
MPKVPGRFNCGAGTDFSSIQCAISAGAKIADYASNGLTSAGVLSWSRLDCEAITVVIGIASGTGGVGRHRFGRGFPLRGCLGSIRLIG